MKNKYFTRITFLCLLVLNGLVWVSCKKDDNDSVVAEHVDIDVTNATDEELILDSAFLYAKQIYMWYEELPSYDEFEPRSYDVHSDMLENLSDEIYDLSQYAINPKTGEPYEAYFGESKYSFVQEADDVSSSLSSTTSYLDGTDTDFGIALTAVSQDDIRIRYVTTGSPAYEAGVRRGDKFTKLDGVTVSAASQSDVNKINNAFDASNMNFEIEKQDGTTKEITLTKSTYTINPVYKDTVLNVENTSIGYLSYGMFTSVSNSQTPIDEAFESFANAGVKNLIVDLRYNGGGYVATADYLLNQIIPSAYDNQTMYTEKFNDLMQAGNATMLENQLLYDSDGNTISYRGRKANYNDIDYSIEGNTYQFEKAGNLTTVENVYFIVTGSTASASELTINSLKPYVNVYLIGSQTYGKPVGFFPITIDQYEMYVPNFETVNSNEEGQYYEGMEPDYEVEDDVTQDFGSAQEACIAQAISLITGIDMTSKSNRENLEIGFNRIFIQSQSNMPVMLDNRIKLKAN